jgi:hypothetical protein
MQVLCVTLVKNMQFLNSIICVHIAANAIPVDESSTIENTTLIRRSGGEGAPTINTCLVDQINIFRR